MTENDAHQNLDLIYTTTVGQKTVVVETVFFVSEQSYKGFEAQIWINQTETGFKVGINLICSSRQYIYGELHSLEEAQFQAKNLWLDFMRTVDSPPRCSICNDIYYPPLDTRCGC